MGNGSIHHSGYRYVQVNGRNIGEHRLVMELMLGRRLRDDENVHHLNGDKLDNEPSNLELWDRRQPPGQRVVDKVRWALKLIADYPEIAAQLEGQEAAVLGYANFNHGGLQWSPMSLN